MNTYRLYGSLRGIIRYLSHAYLRGQFYTSCMEGCQMNTNILDNFIPAARKLVCMELTRNNQTLISNRTSNNLCNYINSVVCQPNIPLSLNPTFRCLSTQHSVVCQPNIPLSVNPILRSVNSNQSSHKTVVNSKLLESSLRLLPQVPTIYQLYHLN
jgi:hypothetical protein